MLSDCSANLTLRSFDFFEISDSSDWAIASNPAEDLMLLDELRIKSGIRKKKSDFKASPSMEYFI